MRDKKKLTQELVGHLPEQFAISSQEAMSLWWHNLRASGGLRLTKYGYETFIKILQLEHYNFNLDPMSMNSRMIVALDRKLQQPWYLISHKQIPRTLVFFGSQEAMLANLYGDIKKFLDNYR